jgi:hypothetical protein
MSKVKFKSYTKRAEKTINRLISIRLRMIGRMMKQYFNLKLEGPRTGRIYPLPTGGFYQASAPGEYPAKKLGNLRKTLAYQVNVEPDAVCLVIGSPMEYAQDLELLKGRPFLRRGIIENLDKIKQMITGELKQ